MIEFFTKHFALIYGLGMYCIGRITVEAKYHLKRKYAKKMIKINMPMPANCFECELSLWENNGVWCPYCQCTVEKQGGKTRRIPLCPLIECEEEHDN